ncbi:MAG: hypothetical protein MJD61_20025 [Proteobacteria bacterium]|nr:hypothetical protein [Pseudomonadota bacterium]
MEQLFDGVPYRKLLTRALHRVSRPALEVPDEKNGFPKVLSLDLNKWIDLARAHYGRPNGEDFAEALHAIRRSIAQQDLVVPIDGANALELMEVRNERRRRELARFMVELSGNHCVRHEQAVTILELARAIVTVFGGETWTEAFRSQLVRRSAPIRPSLASAGGRRHFRHYR